MSIIIDKISYVYNAGLHDEKKALDNIELQINDGEFIGIIGHTGSGKSTLIQHLNGLLKATEGGIYYNGEDIYDKDFELKKIRNKVGLVFQYPEHQLFETSVIKDVSFGPKMQGIPLLDVQMRAFESLKMVGIGEELLDVSPFDLSGGQKRRVAIAGVLAMNPDVLILDEPTAGLDPKGRREILDLISELHRQSGITVILVSHSMEDVAEYVNRIIVMDKGKIKYDDEPEQVFQHVEELESIGLAVPQVSYLINRLRKMGLNIKGNPITVDEAKDTILDIYNKRCL